MKRMLLKASLVALLAFASGCCCFRPPWEAMFNMLPTDDEMMRMMQSRGGQQYYVPAQPATAPPASDSPDASQ